MTAATPAVAPTRGFLVANARWLAAGGLLTLLSSFGQTFFISIFSGEIQAAFGLTEGGWGAIYTLGTGASAAVMLWAGAQADRHSVRDLGTVVLLALAAACLVMAATPFAWALVLSVFLLRLSGQGMTSHIATVAMGRWFDATRGRALAAAGLGFSVGEALLPITFVALLPFTGYRALWVLSAALVLAAIPLLRRLLARERSPKGRADAETSPGMDGAPLDAPGGPALAPLLGHGADAAGPRGLQHGLLLPPGAPRGDQGLAPPGACRPLPALHGDLDRRDAGRRLGGGPLRLRPAGPGVHAAARRELPRDGGGRGARGRGGGDRAHGPHHGGQLHAPGRLLGGVLRHPAPRRGQGDGRLR